MVSPCLPSLLDLCSIRLAYLLWTRRDMADGNRIVYNFFDRREIAALAGAQELPLPKKLQSLVVTQVSPTGGSLISLLSLWLSKLRKFDAPEEWLTFDVLYDCLVLNPYGMINQRRTAQTLLRNNVLHNELAFRLACINFLETEVLKLWILVKEYILNKIVCECNRTSEFQLYINRTSLMQVDDIENIDPYTTEPDEVLFWIAYCLSRENAVDIREVPHFKGSEVDWYECALDSAVSSGNVACFDYFKSFRDGPFEYDCLDTIKRIMRVRRTFQQSSFIFHFMHLNSQEKSYLFREFPERMLKQFLQWPLSQTFLQNTEEVWNLLPGINKYLVLSEVYKILVFENVLWYNRYIPHITQNSLIYCVEHLLGIWLALWNVSPDNYKSDFLDSYIFPDFEDLHVDGYPSRFVTSGLKQKLLSVLLSNGGAVLELYQRETLQESLRSVVAEYMPEDIQHLKRRFLPFFETGRKSLRKFKRNMGRTVVFDLMQNRGISVNERYLYYIKTVAFSLDRI